MVDYNNPYANWAYQGTSTTQPFYRPWNNNYVNYTTPAAQNQSVNTFQWVQGRAAAEAYLVAPGNSVILMDSNAPVIYYKSADQSGRYLPMKTYDLVERVDSETVHTQEPLLDASSYVKRDEIEDLIAKEVDRQLSAPAKSK